MTRPTRLRDALRRVRFVLSLAVLGGACSLALPAHAQQSAPADPPARPGPGLAPREALGLNAAQSALWQAAESATREAHAHALELRARFLRESGDPAAMRDGSAPLRPRVQAMERLHEALEKDRRAVGERWLALDESLDASQRRRLRAMPQVAHWLGLMPPMHGMHEMEMGRPGGPEGRGRPGPGFDGPPR